MQNQKSSVLTQTLAIQDRSYVYLLKYSESPFDTDKVLRYHGEATVTVPDSFLAVGHPIQADQQVL